jgi:hypothetical protein
MSFAHYAKNLTARQAFMTRQFSPQRKYRCRKYRCGSSHESKIIPLLCQYRKNRSMLVMLLGFSVMIGGPAYAGWEVLAVSETGLTVYIDRTSIHQDTDVVTMSVLHDYQTPERLSSGSFSLLWHDSSMIVEKCAPGRLELRSSQSTWGNEQCCIAGRVTIRGYRLRR